MFLIILAAAISTCAPAPRGMTIPVFSVSKSICFKNAYLAIMEAAATDK